MISSRMEDRLAEMGVRKSFGASRSVLLSQVMWENLILTLAGGLVGLIIAWSMLLLGKSWIFTLFEDNPDALYDNSTLGMRHHQPAFCPDSCMEFIAEAYSKLIKRKEIIFNLQFSIFKAYV